MNALNLLHNLYQKSNDIWHEDRFNLSIKATGAGWEVVLTHEYKNKAGSHPETVVFNEPLAANSPEDCINKLKAKVIKRAEAIAKSREDDAKHYHALLTAATEELSRRTLVLQSLYEHPTKA